MKLVTLLLLFVTLKVSAQLPVRGLRRFIISGAISPGTLPVDTSYESKVFYQAMNINYDILRPNKLDTVSANIFFSMNNVPVGASGNVRFVLATGAETVRVNGQLNRSIPTVPGPFTMTYNNILGILNWN